ncbi:MAG: nucleotidyltransferase domain-containing protein [Planctomycetota bacterium]
MCDWPGGGRFRCIVTDARDNLFGAVPEAVVAAYGERLVAFAVFGSWARGVATPASD